MLKCLRRCSWNARINCHDWKLQIRKEIKEAESEKEKSDLSTDQFFGHISLLKIQLTQGWMGWNRNLNIYNCPGLSFSKFSIFEGRN